MMTSRSRFLTRSLFAALWMACLGLVLSGCDSGGGSGSSSEDGTFEVTIKNTGEVTPILKSGAFTPADVINDKNNIPPLEPGEEFEFSFTAGSNELPNTGAAFSFASMFVQSNDAYYATKPGGIPLFDSNDNPIGMSSPKDVTSDVRLYDAGTEADQEPGTGGDQAPRQSGFDTGADENGTITRIENTDSDAVLEDSGFEYPAVDQGIEVTISSQTDAASGGIKFTVNIENESDETGAKVNGAPVVLSPGTYAAHFDQTPGGSEVTFPGHSPGATATNGIERIAEDGKPAGVSSNDIPGNHLAELQRLTGVTVPLSPGAYAVHSDEVSFFSTGSAAPSGLEKIAEDGMPGDRVSTLSGLDAVKSAGAFNTPDGADSPGPLTPGNSYTFEVDAEPGDRLSLATMFIQSNDLFYSFDPAGIALYDSDDNPISGDVTNRVVLYDAGTEGDEAPGVGLNQAPRSGTDTGPSGEGQIEPVTNGSKAGFSYAASDVIEVTITP